METARVSRFQFHSHAFDVANPPLERECLCNLVAMEMSDVFNSHCMRSRICARHNRHTAVDELWVRRYPGGDRDFLNSSRKPRIAARTFQG